MMQPGGFKTGGVTGNYSISSYIQNAVTLPVFEPERWKRIYRAACHIVSAVIHQPPFQWIALKSSATQVVLDKYLVEKPTPLSIRAGVTHDDMLPAPAEHSSHSIALSGLNDSPHGHQ